MDFGKSFHSGERDGGIKAGHVFLIQSFQDLCWHICTSKRDGMHIQAKLMRAEQIQQHSCTIVNILHVAECFLDLGQTRSCVKYNKI